MSGPAPVQPYQDFTHIDGRNVGGRATIMLHMKNHYDKLVDTKPQIKVTAPKKYIYEKDKHVPVHMQPDKRIDPQLEMKHAFRKVAKMTKGYVSTDKPTTYDMDHVKGKFVRGDKFINDEHALNMKSMKKKLGKSKVPPQERKKNTLDPVAHPVRFFRRGKDLPHKKVEYVHGTLAQRLVMTNEDSKLKEKFERSGYAGFGSGSSRMVQSGRPSSAVPAVRGGTPGMPAVQFEQVDMVPGMNSAPGQRPETAPSAGMFGGAAGRRGGQVLVIDENLAMPEVKGDPRAQTLIEKRLLDVIVKHNLYKDAQLEVLFSQFTKANGALDKKLIADSVAHVKQVMDE